MWADSFVDISGLVRMSFFFFFCYKKNILLMGVLSPAFRKKKDPECPSYTWYFLSIFNLKNQYAKVTYFGMTCLVSFIYLKKNNNATSCGFFRSEYSENYKTFLCFIFTSCTLLVLGWNKSEIFDMSSQIFDAIVQWVEPEDWDKNKILSFHI